MRLRSSTKAFSVGFTISVVLASSMVLPLVVSKPAYAMEAKENQFCSNLAATKTNIMTKAISLKAKLTDAQAERVQHLTTNRTKWDKEIVDNRATWDKQRQESFAKLEAKAKTDSQKAAVQAYVASIKAAIETRRAAIDQSRAVYRAAVDAAIAAHTTGVGTQATRFSGSLDSALSAAETSCTTTPSNSAAARTQFLASLKSVHETYSASRKDDDKLGDQIKQLAQTRNAAIRSADDAFKVTTKTARETFKATVKGSDL